MGLGVGSTAGAELVAVFGFCWSFYDFISYYNYSTLAVSKSIPLSFASFSKYESDSSGYAYGFGAGLALSAASYSAYFS